MSGSLNRVFLMGNLTRDVELRYANSGTAVAKLSLAVNTRTGAGDTRKDETLYVDCTAFGRTAEVAGEYCAKGKAVLIEGRLVLHSWEDKQSGQKRSKHEVVIERLQLMGGKGEGGSQPEGGQAGSAPSGDTEDDDIPF